MKVAKTIGIIVLIVLAGGLYLWISRTPTAPSVVQPELLSDVYPLYGKVQWNTPMAETVVVGSTTIEGTSITSALVTNTMDPGSIFMPFEQYYAEKLKALGWKVDNSLAAGGHVGGQMGYQKDSQTILTRFSIIYHNVPHNAPSECPCDVALSLFSASTTGQVNFSADGNAVRNNPGMKPNVWYLVYEKPGSPALTVELDLNSAVPPYIDLTQGERVHIEGQVHNEVVIVRALRKLP